MEELETTLPADLVLDGHRYFGKHDQLVASIKKKP
jgi:hypothetical protein